MFDIPETARILFFKAQQHALFAAPVTVQGHLRQGRYVQPYTSRRKKRMEASQTADLFGATQVQHPVRTHVAPNQPVSPPGSFRHGKPHGENGNGSGGSGNGNGGGGEPPQEQGPFGPIFRQFHHDAQGAIAHLKQQQTGEAVAALYHPEVGDIDLVWGKAGTQKKDYEDGYGLAKIAVKHSEVLANLQEILDGLKGVPEKSTNVYKVLESDDHKALIRLDWDRKSKTWLLTAFEKKQKSGAGSGTIADTAQISGQGDTARPTASSQFSILPSTEKASPTPVEPPPVAPPDPTDAPRVYPTPAAAALAAALKTGDLKGALAVLAPLALREAEAALLGAGFTTATAKTKAALMAWAQPALLAAAKARQDGYAMREPTQKAFALPDACILFFKAGSLKNRPGLALQTLTDKLGHTTQRWKRTTQKPKADAHPPARDPDPHDRRGSARGYGTHDIQPGSRVKFQALGQRNEGKVTAVGSAGATVEDAEGRKHRIHYHEITHHAPGENARPTPSHSVVLGKQDPIPADRFTAADYAKSHDRADVTADQILAGFPPDTKDRIRSAQDRLANIEQTIDRFKQNEKWTAQREVLHHKIIADILSPERVKAATPAPGEKPTFMILGGRGGCLSGDHEYLTRAGWKRIDQYETGEEILVFDPNMNTTQFELPQDYINLPCEEFLHFKSRGVDMMLSEEHKILFNKKYNPNVWRTESALEVAAQHDRLVDGWDGMIPCTFPAPDNASGIDLTDDELRLMVAVCADGSFALQTTNHCRMALRKDRKKARIRELMNRCGIEFTETTYDNRPTESRFSFYAPSNNKTLSAYWNASPAQLSIIADEILQWDGWEDQYGSWVYTSTNYDDIDFASYLFSSQGRRSSFYCDDREDTGWKPIWRISGAKNGGFAGLRYSNNKSPIEIIPSADGRKYCFTVSTGFFVTRRNDCVAVTGNSGKSSLEGQVYDKAKFIVLDADEIKKALPEYEGWNAHQVHEESSDIFEEITNLAQNLELNLCHDATMKTTKKAVDLVKRFKAAGYRTEAHYMHLPRQEAAKRAVKRFLDGGEKGRYVPVEVVLSNTSNEASFDAVKALVDRWSFRDNNVPKGSPPILISESAPSATPLRKALDRAVKTHRPLLIMKEKIHARSLP